MKNSFKSEVPKLFNKCCEVKKCVAVTSQYQLSSIIHIFVCHFTFYTDDFFIYLKMVSDQIIILKIVPVWTLNFKICASSLSVHAMTMK